MKGLLLILLLLPVFAAGQIITTIAGTGSSGYTGDGGPALDAKLQWSCGLSFDGSGDLYIVGGNRVRKIDETGTITTIAGSGGVGYSGDGGPATAATFNIPAFLAIDKAGKNYIADWFNNVIRKVDTDGIITTFAGNGTQGYSGDGGPATAAMLDQTSGIAVDTAGNVYVGTGSRIRKIATSGIITTIAGNGVPGYSGDGGPATAAMLHGIEGICVDNKGNVIFADNTNGRVRMISTSGIITTVAGNGYGGYTGDGGLATDATVVPMDVCADKFGNIYISHHNATDAIRVVNSAGYIYTIAGSSVSGFSGDGGLATLARLSYAYGIVLDSCGNLYLMDANNYRVRKVTFPTCNYESVPTVAIDRSISLYPNPATKQITIQSTNQPINQISIANLLGQTLYTHQYIPTAIRTTQAEVDVSTLPAGVYLVRVNGTEVRTFVKE